MSKADKKEADFTSISDLRNSLEKAQKKSQKDIAGSFFSKPSEDEQIDVLEQDFYRLSEFVEQCAPIIEAHSSSIQGLKASGKEDVIESLGDCLQWSKELIAFQLDRLNDETMNMPCLIKATNALYSGAIHLCSGLADILSGKLGSKEQNAIVVERTIQLHHASSVEAISNLDQKQKVIGKSILHKEDDRAQSPGQDAQQSRKDRITMMKSPQDRLDDIDGGVAVEVEAIEVDAALVEVMKGLGVANVTAGEERTAIKVTHAATAEEEKSKASEGEGRGG